MGRDRAAKAAVLPSSKRRYAAVTVIISVTLTACVAVITSLLKFEKGTTAFPVANTSLSSLALLPFPTFT